MKKLNLAVFAWILFAALSASAEDYKVMIQGVLASYNDKGVVIRQPSSELVTVPNSSLPDKSGLITGKAHVTVFVSPTDLVELNPRFSKKTK